MCMTAAVGKFGETAFAEVETRDGARPMKMARNNLGAFCIALSLGSRASDIKISLFVLPVKSIAGVSQCLCAL